MPRRQIWLYLRIQNTDPLPHPISNSQKDKTQTFIQFVRQTANNNTVQLGSHGFTICDGRGRVTKVREQMKTWFIVRLRGQVWRPWVKMVSSWQKLDRIWPVLGFNTCRCCDLFYCSTSFIFFNVHDCFFWINENNQELSGQHWKYRLGNVGQIGA